MSGNYKILWIDNNFSSIENKCLPFVLFAFTTNSNCAVGGNKQHLHILMMKTFLASSTIHGLSYISSSRRYSRLFWIMVVITGFGVATFLISKSFRGWKESPVSTSIEVRPIVEVTFPNVTVCPPRDTFTEINHDLQTVDRIQLDPQTRLELLSSLDDLLLDYFHGTTLRQMDWFSDRDRLRHWYEGRTEIVLPYWKERDRLQYVYHTTATAGEIVTPFYGEPWQDDKFLQNFRYSMYIMNPLSGEDRLGNISLVFDIDQDLITEVKGYNGVNYVLGTVYDHDYSYVSGEYIDRSEKTVTLKRSSDENYYQIEFERSILALASLSEGREKIPGLRVSWAWSEAVSSQRRYRTENRQFVRLVNMLSKARLAQNNQKVLIIFTKNFLKPSLRTICGESLGRLGSSQGRSWKVGSARRT